MVPWLGYALCFCGKIDKFKLKAIKVFYRYSFLRSEPTPLRTSSARHPGRSPSPPTPTTQPSWWGSPSPSSSSPSSWSGSSTATTSPSSSSARSSPASHTGMTFSSSVSGRQGELPPALENAGSKTRCLRVQLQPGGRPGKNQLPAELSGKKLRNYCSFSSDRFIISIELKLHIKLIKSKCVFFVSVCDVRSDSDRRKAPWVEIQYHVSNVSCTLPLHSIKRRLIESMINFYLFVLVSRQNLSTHIHKLKFMATVGNI